MLLLGMGMYAVSTTGDDVPPPGGGVVTVKLKLPGNVTAEAGRFTVSSPEFTYVDAICVPFTATVEPDVNPVPLRVI
jgi:hypothetical protein